MLTNNPTITPTKKVLNGSGISVTRIEDKKIKEKIKKIANMALSVDLFIIKSLSRYILEKKTDK